jgi:ribonuclease Z
MSLCLKKRAVTALTLKVHSTIWYVVIRDCDEDPGRDIHCDEDGLWRDFEDDDGIQVDAGPIEHRGVSSLIPISPRVRRNPVPCFGYVFKEKPKPRVTPQYLSMLDDIPRAHLPADVWNPRYLLKDLRQGRGVTLENREVIEPPEISSMG